MGLGVILLASCNPTNQPNNHEAATSAPELSSTPLASTTTSTPTAILELTPEPTNTQQIELKPTFIPTPSELPMGFEQSLPFDGIFPIYNPFFVNADEAPLQDDELILGIAWDGEAKAYPITVLRFREMVNDELAGIPTLITY
jgi:hypothetical protein